MIQDILEFSGTSVRKALTIESKRKHTSDDMICLDIALRIKSKLSFEQLWKIANIWTVKHLYEVLEFLNSKANYSDKIFKHILKAPTTKDIMMYLDAKSKKKVMKLISKIAKDNEIKPVKFKKLKNLKAPRIKLIT